MEKLSRLARDAFAWARREGSTVLGRVRDYLWVVVQCAVAATVAWVIAGGLIDDHFPFFAPIAAVIALNTVGGERGTNAVRMLFGVVIGIVVGELSIALTGGGYATMVVAIAVAMTAAVAFGAARLVIAQAASGAILTLAVADGQVGVSRLTDALIGAGVALTMSQLLFPTRPAAWLRRIENEALHEIVRLLDATGRALKEDEDPSLRTVNRLSALSRPMADLSRAQENSHRSVRWTTARWASPGPLAYEDEKVDRPIISARAAWLWPARQPPWTRKNAGTSPRWYWRWPRPSKSSQTTSVTVRRASKPSTWRSTWPNRSAAARPRTR